MPLMVVESLPPVAGGETVETVKAAGIVFEPLAIVAITAPVAVVPSGPEPAASDNA